MLANLTKFLDPSVKHWDDTLLVDSNHNVRTVVCLGTGMTGEGGYLDDTLLVDSNHNVRTVMCFDTGILSSNHKKPEFQYLIFNYSSLSLNTEHQLFRTFASVLSNESP